MLDLTEAKKAFDNGWKVSPKGMLVANQNVSEEYIEKIYCRFCKKLITDQEDVGGVWRACTDCYSKDCEAKHTKYKQLAKEVCLGGRDCDLYKNLYAWLFEETVHSIKEDWLKNKLTTAEDFIGFLDEIGEAYHYKGYSCKSYFSKEFAGMEHEAFHTTEELKKQMSGSGIAFVTRPDSGRFTSFTDPRYVAFKDGMVLHTDAKTNKASDMYVSFLGGFHPLAVWKLR